MRVMLVVIFSGALAGQASAAAPKAEARLSPQERMEIEKKVLSAAESAATKRKETIDLLLTVLQEHPGEGRESGFSHKVRVAAVETLGKMRAARAAPVLVRNITKVKKMVNRGTLLGIEQRPAVVALIEIGKPSLPPALACLAETDDADERHLLGWVLLGVEGSKRSALLQLAMALEREKNPERKERLRSFEARLKRDSEEGWMEQIWMKFPDRRPPGAKTFFEHGENPDAKRPE